MWTTRSFFDMLTPRRGLRQTGPMRSGEVDAIAEALGRAVVEVRPLAGGFSHETCLLILAGGDRVVARLGGTDPAIEAAVLAHGRTQGPVPLGLPLVPSGTPG